MNASPARMIRLRLHFKIVMTGCRHNNKSALFLAEARELRDEGAHQPTKLGSRAMAILPTVCTARLTEFLKRFAFIIDSLSQQTGSCICFVGGDSLPYN